MQAIPDAPAIVNQLGDAIPVEQIMPMKSFLFGGGVLVGVVILHGFLMRTVQTRIAVAAKRQERDPQEWKADLLLGAGVSALLSAVIVELIVWTTAIKYMGFFRSWSGAAYYAANTYTTLGYGTTLLPVEWRMVGPIMATSGLFTFAWTGSVLVDVVTRVGKLKDMAAEAREARREQKRRARVAGRAPNGEDEPKERS